MVALCLALLLGLARTADDPNESLNRINQCAERGCPEGYVLMKNLDYVHTAKGCPDLKFDIMAGLGSHPGQGKLPKECCIEREVCYQTCGKTSAECDNNWNECQMKHCGANVMCRLSLMMAANLRVPSEGIEECDVYEKNQEEGCVCVPEDQRREHMLEGVKKFYAQSKKLTAEKLDENGELSQETKDAIVDKWADREAELFLQLAMKYHRINKIVKIIGKEDPSEKHQEEKEKKEREERAEKTRKYWEAEEDQDEVEL